MKYEEKVKDAILKFVDTVQVAIVYLKMKRITNLLDYLKEEKATLELVLDKWIVREADLESIYSQSQEEVDVDDVIDYL